MKRIGLAVVAATLLAGCAGNHGRGPSVGVGVAIGGSPTAPAPGGGPPPWAPAHGRRAKEAAYRYYYYPTAGVYYNVATRSYFYLNGGSWQVSMTLPSTVVIDANDYVSLELNTDRPYLHYDEHKVKFKGKHGRGHGKGHSKKHGRPF